jgi:hypothetical protein
MISVKAEVSNIFAGKPQLKLYKEGTLINPGDLVRSILPYLNSFDAWDVISGTKECILRSKGEVTVTVDFSGYTDLRDTPICPDEWLKELESKCRLVHIEFTRFSSPKSKMVVRSLSNY